MTKITIAYTTDANTLPQTLVSMVSVLKNARKNDEAEFAVLYSRLEDKYCQTLDNLQAVKNYHLRLLKVDGNIFDGFPVPEAASSESWFKCLLADLLPEEDKVLYLDNDTIVRASLDELFKLEMDNTLIAGIENIEKSTSQAERLMLTDNLFVNTDVVLMNLKQWRKEDFFASLKTTVMTDHKIADVQDALNKACDGRKYRLSPKYNYMAPAGRKTEPDYDDKALKEFAKAEENPIIVHFNCAKPAASKNKFAPEFIEDSKLVPAFDTMQKESSQASAAVKQADKTPWYKRVIKKLIKK